MVMGVLVISCYFFREEILDLIKQPVEAPLFKYTSSAVIVNQPEGIKEAQDIKTLSNSYQCSCEPVTNQLSGIAPDQSGSDISMDSKNSKKKEQPKTPEEISEPESLNWIGKAKEAALDFVAYFQVMIGKEPTASPHYVKQTNVTNKAVDNPKFLNCQCQLKSDGQYGRSHSSMIYIGLPELFFAQMKAAIFTGFFLAFPYLLIELWGFIGPALYRAEKQIYWIFAITSYICFIGGSLFGYFIVFPFGFDFFLSLTQPGEIMPSLAVGEYLNLSIKLLLAFGFIFEMPLITFILARLGIITPELMLKQARIAILIIFIFSAFLTPPDPFTMVLMAGPLIVLYLISVLVCLVGVNRKKVALKQQGLEEDKI